MNRNIFGFFLITTLSTAWGGCGDDGGTGGTGGAGTSSSSSTSSSSGNGGAGGSSSGPPQAPMMLGAVPMQGALHVTWENVTPDCETIELDRNHDGGAFATEYTLAGVATSQHDTEAVPPGSYCYKARCTKGAEVSPDSNEVCGTP
jgi:hypothetical protein